jgi:pyruvate/2-oxoglutarate dehydrogenase complex dihydrolipoamide dehydrogenase (E3) component
MARHVRGNARTACLLLQKVDRRVVANRRAMSAIQKFDFCVIGTGSAGYSAAVTARNLGKSVAVVDGTGPLAGLCILRGCMPSKTLLRSAEIADLVRKAPDLGIEAGQPSVNFTNVMARKRRIIKEFTDHRIEGIEKFPLFRGDAKFVSRTELQVGNARIQAERYLVATGSIINVPEIPGLADAGYVTSDDVLEFDALPRSIVVLGGGPTACELGQYLARLGVQTTLVQRSKSLLSGEDPDIGASLQKSLEADGIRVITGTTVKSAERVGDIKRVNIESAGRLDSVESDEIFVALGRRANLEGLGLDTAGIDHDRHGVKVDKYLQTSNSDVYAAGDVLHESNQLVHVAVYEGQTAAQNAFTLHRIPADYRLQTARAVFTDPQVAVVGLSESECKDRNIQYAVAMFPFDDLGKAISTNLTQGFIKMLAAPDGTMLGVAIVGAEASDLIHESIALLYFKANVRDVMMMPHLHPTLAEIITYPAEELLERLENEKRALVTP